jgi:hypothetical protein
MFGKEKQESSASSIVVLQKPKLKLRKLHEYYLQAFASIRWECFGFSISRCIVFYEIFLQTAVSSSLH